MPNLGAAFGAGWEDYLTKQAATKHQAMLDEISRQHEIRLAQEGLDHHAESLAVQHQNELKLQEQIEQGKQKQIDGVMKDVLPDDALTDDTRQKLESIEQGLSARLFPKSAPEVVPGPTEDGFPLQQQDPRALFLGHAVDRKAIVQNKAETALGIKLAGMPNATRQEVAQAALGSGAVPIKDVDEFVTKYMDPKTPNPPAPVKVTYRENGVNKEKWVTPVEAQALGVLASPTQPPAITNNMMNSPPVGDYSGATKGEEFLKTIPAEWRSMVRKIGDYDEGLTTATSMRGGMRERVQQWVNQYNPDYSQDMFTIRAPIRKAFTVGVEGKTINAINTAMDHIDQMDGLVKQLGNGAFVPGNAVWNKIRTMVGYENVTNFDTLKEALSGEVAKALTGNETTIASVNAQRDHINAANSPDQLLGYALTSIPIMGAKLNTYTEQWETQMGKRSPAPVVFARAREILIRHGFDPDHPNISSAGSGGGGAPQTPANYPNAIHYDMQGNKITPGKQD